MDPRLWESVPQVPCFVVRGDKLRDAKGTSMQRYLPKHYNYDSLCRKHHILHHVYIYICTCMQCNVMYCNVE